MSTSKFRVLRTCEFCGKEFYAQKVTTRFCSRRCNELAYKQRRRQRQITEAEARVLQKPIEEVGNKEFLSLQDTSVLFGITKRSVYNLIYNGVLQAFKLSSRMTLIRRADIERNFESHVYTKKVKPGRKPITEFYTTTEIKEKFGVSESWVFKIGKEKNIPKILHHGKTYWSKQHVEKHFSKHIENNAIVEWDSVREMMEKFNMTTSAVYCFVSKYGISRSIIRIVIISLSDMLAARRRRAFPSEGRRGIFSISSSNFLLNSSVAQKISVILSSVIMSIYFCLTL